MKGYKLAGEFHVELPLEVFEDYRKAGKIAEQVSLQQTNEFQKAIYLGTCKLLQECLEQKVEPNIENYEKTLNIKLFNKLMLDTYDYLKDKIKITKRTIFNNDYKEHIERYLNTIKRYCLFSQKNKKITFTFVDDSIGVDKIKTKKGIIHHKVKFFIPNDYY